MHDNAMVHIFAKHVLFKVNNSPNNTYIFTYVEFAYNIIEITNKF